MEAVELERTGKELGRELEPGGSCLVFAFPRLVLWCHDLAAMDLGETEKVERDFTVSRDDTYHLFQNGKGFESVTWGNECLNSEL